MLITCAGAMYCVKHAQGRVADSITVTSGTAVERPHRGWTLSVGAGGALKASMQNIAVDLAPMRINCIVPGAVETEMWDVSFVRRSKRTGLALMLVTQRFPPERRKAFVAEINEKLPVKHIGQPEEVAEAVSRRPRMRLIR
jgi:NAD(P)-dependent dehydrogenase (short-subunit alcohol dehydrogenase family)